MKWYEIKDKGDKAEIWIYEQIGEDWWSGGGVTAKGFQKELSAIKASQIDLHINSPGGEVFDGITIYNLIRQHSAKVTTYIDGLAASIASVIALAGDRVIMADNALYMIHQPFGMTMGTADDMRKMADTLDKVGTSLVVSYVEKTGKTAEDILAMMEAETWFTAAEALQAGFVDEVSEKMDMAACTKFVPTMVKAQFRHIPDELSAQEKPLPTARECERALRQQGCSEKQAKAILADGYASGIQRDVEAQEVSEIVDEAQRDVAPPPAKEPVVEATVQRDVAQQPETKRHAPDRVAELLVRAERTCPLRYDRRFLEAQHAKLQEELR